MGDCGHGAAGPCVRARAHLQLYEPAPQLHQRGPLHVVLPARVCGSVHTAEAVARPWRAHHHPSSLSTSHFYQHSTVTTLTTASHLMSTSCWYSSTQSSRCILVAKSDTPITGSFSIVSTRSSLWASHSSKVGISTCGRYCELLGRGEL